MLMIQGTEKQHDADMECFDKELPGREQTDNHMDSNNKEVQPLNQIKLLDTESNDRAYNHAPLTDGLSKSMFTVYTKGPLFRVSKLDGTS